MKKTITKITTYLLMFILTTTTIFTIAGCSTSQLSAPSGIKYTKNKLEWNYVDSALEYIVNIDGSEYVTTNNYYDLSTIDMVEGKNFTVKIKAKGDGYLKTNSAYSQEFTFTYSMSSAVIPEETTNLTENEIESIINSNSLESAYFGIGRGINAISDEYATFNANIFSRQKVFDFNKLSNLNWIKANVGKMRSRSVTETSAKDYYDKFNEEIKSKFSAGGSYNLFSASVETSFALAQKEEYKSVSNEIFSTFEQVCGAELVAIDEYANVSQYENILSEAFLNEASKVTNKETAMTFIEKFGTHVITAGYFGGKISFNYYLSNSESAWDSNKSNQIELSVSAGVKGLCEASTSTQWSGASSMGLKENKSFEDFKAFTVGGNFINANNIDKFMENYDSWISFINNKEDYSNVLVDYAEDSLIEIWELLPERYADIKVIIKNAFESMAVDKNTRLYEKYYREKIDVTPIKNDLEIKCCQCDTDFNPQKQETEEMVKNSHDKFKMGELVLYGCTVNGEGKYSLHDEEEFTIKYHILENPKSLPMTDELKNAGVQAFEVSNDSATKIYGYNDFNQTIGYGASYVRVTYKDATKPKTFKVSNLMKDRSRGDIVEIANNTGVGNIESIEVVVVYELFYWSYNWTGIFADRKYPNFRTTYTYYFA